MVIKGNYIFRYEVNCCPLQYIALTIDEKLKLFYVYQPINLEFRQI